MPVCLRPHELEVGMRLAKPVTHDRRVLLPGGKVLNTGDISNLQREYPHLSVFILDPVLDGAVKFQDVSAERKVAASAREKLVHALTGVREKFAARMSLGNLDLRGVHEAMAQIVQYLDRNPTAAAMIMPPGKEDCYLTEHPASVFYVSLVVGNAVRNLTRRTVADRNSRKNEAPKQRAPLNLAPLGLAALFMDTALWAIEEALDRPGPLARHEREIVLRHPDTSAQALPDSIPSLVPDIIRNHHENFDGTGYPRGVDGATIPLFSRILRVADAFDAATSSRVFREAKSPPRVLWEMTMGSYSHFYDPTILKVFGTVVQPYPIGAKLRLADGRYGVVVRFGESYSLLPEIIVAFDENGKRLPREKLEGPYKLINHPDIRIASYGEDDLSDIYGEGTWYTDVAYPHPASFETLFESVYP